MAEESWGELGSGAVAGCRQWSTDAAGERNVNGLVRGLGPILQDGQWVFVTVDEVPPGVAALATFREQEGLSLLLRREQADAVGLAYDFVAAWITLTVHSALAAVGLTAAVAGHLAAGGISCNVVAARHHDHLLVPHERAQQALALLQELAASPDDCPQPPPAGTPPLTAG